MTHSITTSALALALIAVPAAAIANAPIEGHWRNPKGSVTVIIAPCGDALCGTVTEANAKARATALKGGTKQLIGARILTGMRASGQGEYRGRVFDPKRNIHAPATLRLMGSATLVVRGCVMHGFICKEQRWTRVG